MADQDTAAMNSKAPIDQPIATFKVTHRETGDELVVDHRTFDPEVHERADEKPAVRSLDKMTVAELTALAAEKGVEIPAGSIKKQIIALLS